MKKLPPEERRTEQVKTMLTQAECKEFLQLCVQRKRSVSWVLRDLIISYVDMERECPE